MPNTPNEFVFADILSAREKYAELGEELNSLVAYIGAQEKKIRNFNQEENVRHLREQIEDAYNHSIHVLSDNELKSLTAFKETHHGKCSNHGRYIFDIEQTGGISLIRVQCPFCQEEVNITDFSSL